MQSMTTAQKTPAPQMAAASPMTKTNSAKGNEVDMATIGTRPLRLQDMLKTAMAQSASKVNVSLEASRLTDDGESREVVKQASAGGDVDHEYALKLASAIEYIAQDFPKEANEIPGNGPGHLTVMHATSSTPMSTDSGHGHNTVPMHTGLQAAVAGAATQMENDHARAPGGPGHQTTAMTAGKGKKASAIRDAFKKVAADSNNPAKISAGPAVPPDASASGESGGAPVGGAPQGPTGLISSNESARDYKPGTAHSPRKAELKQYFNEPALSSATDKTLAAAFDSTAKAGTKFASAQVGTGTKVAAARAVLAKLAEDTKGA